MRDLLSLPNLAQSFLTAVEIGVESGVLVDRFTRNPAMDGLSVLHALKLVADEVTIQSRKLSERSPT